MSALSRLVLAGLLFNGIAAFAPLVSIAEDRSWLAAEPSKLERAVEAAMSEPVSLSFRDATLEEFVARVEELSGVPFALDRKALIDSGISADAPVTLDLSDVSLRAAVRLALDQLDLCWVVQDQFVLVTTKLEAENLLATKIYDVADLVGEDARKMADFRPLIELITAEIAATTWDQVGGPASIRSVQMSGIRAVVVSQTEEVHFEIKNLLEALRRLKKSGVAASAKTTKIKPHVPPRKYAVAPAWTLPHIHE